MVTIFQLKIMQFCLLIFISVMSLTVNATDKVWVLVDTKAKTLDVLKGEQTVDSFENIAIGRRGAGFKEQRGDDVTPLGTYKIGWINRQSHFGLFFGFDYPSLENAQRALNDGLISRKAFKRILRAHQDNRVPPQNTALGGQIGIHGLGNADLTVHKEFDWTHGCIALTNPQVRRLYKWINTGTLVKVK